MWRSLLSGLWAGILLQAVRAPAGLDLLQLPAAFGLEAASVRALGWFALAAGLGLRGSQARFSAPSWLSGALLGFAAHGLLLAPLLAPASRVGLMGLAALLALFSILAGRPQGEPDDSQDTRGAEALGWVLLGLATELAFEGLTRPLERLGLGLEGDAFGIGLALLLATWLGALSFGPGLKSPRAAALALAAVPALAAVGWTWLGRFDEPLALERFLKRLSVPLGNQGSLPWNLVIAGAALLLPGLTLGAALAGVLNRGRAAALAAGVGLGGIFGVLTLESAQVAAVLGEPLAGLASQELFARAGWIALPGLLLALGVHQGRAGAWPAFAAGALLCAAPTLRRAQPHLLSAPHASALPTPMASLENSQGLFTINPTLDGGRVLCLDGRRLTPGPTEELSDLRQLSAGLAALDLFELGGSAPRVLLLGPLTPKREALLGKREGLELERCVPWFEAAPTLEALLFNLGAPNLGTWVEPKEARARLSRGEYDLVLAPCEYGAALEPSSTSDRSLGPARRVVTSQVHCPDKTALIAWFPATSPISAQPFGPRVLLASDGLFNLSVGLLAGAARDWPVHPGADFPGSFAAGELRDLWPWEQLNTSARERAERWQANLTARLTDADQEPAAKQLFQGLDAQFQAQRPSAPWEGRLTAMELDRDGMRSIGAAAEALGSDPFVRQLAEGAARLATVQRHPDWVLESFSQAAERQAPWPEMVEALVRADLELLDPQRALERLIDLRRIGPAGDATELLRAEVLIGLGRLEDAREALGSLARNRPADPALRRRLALLADRAGLEGSEALLREALRLFPGDAELRRTLFPDIEADQAAPEEGPELPGPPPPGGH